MRTGAEEICLEVLTISLLNTSYEQKSLMDAQKFYILLIAVAAGQVIEMIVFGMKTKDMTFIQYMKSMGNEISATFKPKGKGRIMF